MWAGAPRLLSVSGQLEYTAADRARRPAIPGTPCEESPSQCASSSPAAPDISETDILGTLGLLEEAVAAGVKGFVFTSTTSVFGRTLTPVEGASAAWITESVVPEPRNIYGVTKLAAENLCVLFCRSESLPCIILRTSRFFPDEDDRRDVRERFDHENVKANEFLYRRVDLQDAVSAHLAAIDRASDLGFGRYTISATTPFSRADRPELRSHLRRVVARLQPGFEQIYEARG